MIRVHKLVSTSLGIGYIGKGGGTVAAVATCICWYFVFRAGGGQLVSWQPLLLLVVTALGIWSAGAVEPLWGKDDKKVVIDEVAGMGISLLFLPVTLGYIVAALVLFRFFDIAKPLLIRRLERVEGGWGVMLDDVVAGVYTNLLLQLYLYLAPTAL
ncbi:phosphatidylglycerophosphatase A [Pontibacter qinzhouensis]|uniref:Phosphatidylglycerophosphatase A n=1 Tax=Pontibacter qinzhouensis TaxID=2603253 RepID=A0A5C8JFS5_9BACT|nr:phosphatidylglycerophosphatase A [Pontibacter qinzhouensis]TXK37335.1 phosphatidylglycerophosphatase A [Pontibacter qinzhouensis]